MIIVENFSSYVSEYAPELRDLYITLMPFEDVIHSVHAGPQSQSKHYDPEEAPYFSLDFSEWKNGEIIILRFWRIEKDRVVLETDDGEFPSSMPQLWNFLRQLPRDPYVFVNSAD